MSSLRPAAVLGLLLVLALAAGGCGRVAKVDRHIALEDALRGYGTALRWAHINTANSYLRAPDGTPLATASAFRDDVRVAEYRVTAREWGAEEGTVTIHAEYKYYLVASNVLREAKETQRWWYDPDARRWYLEGDLPAALVVSAPSDAAPGPR